MRNKTYKHSQDSSVTSSILRQNIIDNEEYFTYTLSINVQTNMPEKIKRI